MMEKVIWTFLTKQNQTKEDKKNIKKKFYFFVKSTT